MKVSVYTRQHGSRKLLKASTSKTYPPDTIFVLRYGGTWETLPAGTDFGQPRIAGLNKKLALKLGRQLCRWRSPGPRSKGR